MEPSQEAFPHLDRKHTLNLYLLGIWSIRRTTLTSNRRHFAHPLRSSVLQLCLFLVSLLLAHAQSATTGAIGGTVSDASGALLPGTAVTVSSPDTGFTRTVKSNASGEYSVPELDPGTYTASFTADGFETYRENSITVTVGSLTAVSPVLKPGSVTTSVEVTDQAPLMHTESTTSLLRWIRPPSTTFR